MQQSKAYVIKSAARHLKASISRRKSSIALARDEYVAYRYGHPNARKITLARGGVR